MSALTTAIITTVAQRYATTLQPVPPLAIAADLPGYEKGEVLMHAAELMLRGQIRQVRGGLLPKREAR